PRLTLPAAFGIRPDCLLAFNGDGTRLAVAYCAQGAVRLWDVPAGKPVADFLAGNLEKILAVQVSPDGRHVAAADGRTLMIWEVGGKTGPTFSIAASSLAFSRDGNRLFVGCLDGHLRVVDMNSRQLLDALPAQDFKGGGITCLALSPDGRLLA